MVVRSVQMIDSNNNRIFLEKRDTSYISEFAPNDSTTGTPKYWANWEDNVQQGQVILVAPTPATADTVQLIISNHHQNLQALLILIYLQTKNQCCCMVFLSEAFRFLKGPMDMYNLYEKKYNEETQNFALQQMGRRRRAEYDDGVPRIQIPSPTPKTN